MEKEIVGAKPEWMYRQSGVVPLIEVGGAPGVVLITSTSTGLWCFPKGVIEPGMTARDSALKEAYEEAGLRGFALEAEIGEYQYQKWSGKCTVKMFVMEVEEILDDWEDKKARKRSICPVDEALGLLEGMDLKNILRSALGLHQARCMNQRGRP